MSAHRACDRLEAEGEGALHDDRLSPEDAALYARLVQVPWHAAMILEGHTGGHVGTSLPGFIRTEVAPWLKTMPER